MGYDPSQIPQGIAAKSLVEGLTIAQVFYYAMGGLAALIISVKSMLAIRKWRNRDAGTR